MEGRQLWVLVLQGVPTQTGTQGPWPLLATRDIGVASLGCTTKAQDLFRHLLNTHLGLAWARSCAPRWWGGWKHWGSSVLWGNAGC